MDLSELPLVLSSSSFSHVSSWSCSQSITIVLVCADCVRVRVRDRIVVDCLSELRCRCFCVGMGRPGSRRRCQILNGSLALADTHLASGSHSVLLDAACRNRSESMPLAMTSTLGTLHRTNDRAVMQHINCAPDEILACTGRLAKSQQQIVCPTPLGSACCANSGAGSSRPRPRRSRRPSPSKLGGRAQTTRRPPPTRPSRPCLRRSGSSKPDSMWGAPALPRAMHSKIRLSWAPGLIAKHV
jgi:hypothetical protein